MKNSKKFIVFILLAASLCYEAHLFKYYSAIQIFISLMLVIFMLFFLKRKERGRIEIKNKRLFFIIAIFRVINTLLGALIFGYTSTTGIVSSFIMLMTSIALFYAMPTIIKSENKNESVFVKTIIAICVALAIFSILIKIGNGHFLIWDYVYVIRDASIYYDPNFCAMVLGTGLAISITHKFKRSLIKIATIILLAVAIIYTGSRGALLSIVISTLIYLLIYSSISKMKKIIIITAFAAMTIIGVNYLYSIDYFRTYQGSNDRFEMWTSITESISKSPIIGYGYGSTSEVLKANNYSYASTHNSFIDFMLIYGIPLFMVYITLIVKLLLRTIKQNKNYSLPMMYMLLNSNSILYSFGGVGFSSMVFTIVLGIANAEERVGREKPHENN